jgi:nicotinamidase-related amidase
MTSVLLLVDVQKNMLERPEPVPDADAVGEAIKNVLGRARSAGTPVIHIRNNGGEEDPDLPGTPGWELVHEVAPGEHVVDKHECDAFAGTGLPGLVPESATVIVAGLQSEFCIRETSLSALRRGHPVVLVRCEHAAAGRGKTAARSLKTGLNGPQVTAGPAEVRPGGPRRRCGCVPGSAPRRRRRRTVPDRAPRAA